MLGGFFLSYFFDVNAESILKWNKDVVNVGYNHHLKQQNEMDKISESMAENQAEGVCTVPEPV